MDLLIALESLKFYKLKNERTVQILFLIIYALFLGFDLFPIGEPISIDTINSLLQKGTASNLPLLTSGNIISFASQIALTGVTSFFALIYANCFVMQSEDIPNRKAAWSTFRGLPKLLGFLLLMTIPVAISSLFAFIPLVYLFFALYFTPILITEKKKGIIEAVIGSYQSTKGLKMTIFMSQILLYFIMNIPITIFGSIFLNYGYENTLAESLVLSFLRAAYVLMGGRLVGNFYMLAIKNKENIKNGKIDGFKNPLDLQTPEEKDVNGKNSDDK